MKSRVLIAALALSGAVELGAVVITAENRIATQTPPPTQPMPRPPRTKGTTAVPGTLSPTEITIVGCLYRTADVAPNAEGASRAKEFILTDASLARSNTPPASGTMYQIDKLDAATLAPHAGKRVEVTGQIEPDDESRPKALAGATAPGLANPSKLPELDGVSIRQVGGGCPARPTTR